MFDSRYKFIIKARTTNLITQEFMELMNGTPRTHCKKCNKQVNGSLMHVLNGCICYYGKYTTRHNSICTALIKSIKDKRTITKIVENSKVMDCLPGNISMLRPDIQIWEGDNKLLILEISAPYPGKYHNIENIDKVYYEKKLKYLELTNELNRREIDTEYYPIIISSLGGWNMKSARHIIKLLGKTNGNDALRKISQIVIRESEAIWNERCPITLSEEE